MKYLYIVIVLLLLSSCTKGDMSVSERTPKLQWQYNVNGNRLFATLRPIIYKNKVIYSKYFFDETGSSIFALDKNTGEELWTWNEYTQWDISSRGQTYLYENVLVFSFKGTTYAINLDTGATEWKITTGERGIGHVIGLGSKIYQVSSLANGEKFFVNEINIDNGTWRNLLEIEGRDTLIPFVKTPAVQINPQNDTIIYLSKILYNYSNYHAENHLMTYNITQDTFEYDIVHEYDDIYQGSLGSPKIYDNKIYIPVDGYMFCYTIDGEFIWKKFIEGGTGFTGFIIEDDKLFVGSEGFNPSLYALNPDTGAQLWKIASSGTSSLMAYLNGVIYFTGGGDGLLHAVDAANGEHLWREKSPDVEENSDAFFNDVVTADPETGRIYTASWISVLCYEAAR